MPDKDATVVPPYRGQEWMSGGMIRTTGLVNVMVLVSSGVAWEVSVDDELVTSLSALVVCEV